MVNTIIHIYWICQYGSPMFFYFIAVTARKSMSRSGERTPHAAAACRVQEIFALEAGTGCGVVLRQAVVVWLMMRISAARRRTRDSVPRTSIMRLLLPSVLRAVNRAKLLLGSQVRCRLLLRAVYSHLSRRIFTKSR